MSAIAETPTDDSVEVIQVLFALHPSFGAQELCGPLEVLTNALHRLNDPSMYPIPLQKTDAVQCLHAIV